MKSTAFVPFQNASLINASTAKISNSLNLTGSTVDFKDATVLNFALDTIYTDFVFEKTTDAGVSVEHVLIKDGLVDTVNVSGFKLDYDAKINQALLTTSNPSFQGITITNLNGYGASAGFVKRASDGKVSIDTTTYLPSTTPYESPLTFSTGLTRTVDTITVNTSQNITQLSNLSSAGFVVSDAKGNLSVDTGSYILGTITLSGDISGSGTNSITTTIGALKVLNSMLAGGIEASKLVGTDITTVGTISTGTWQGTAIGTLYGGTGATSYTNGQILIGNASNGLTKATLTGTTNQIDITNGSGSITLSIPSDLRVQSTRISNVSDGTKYTTLTTDATGRFNIASIFGTIQTADNLDIYGSSASIRYVSVGNSNTGNSAFISTVQSGGTADCYTQYVVGSPAVSTYTTGVDQSDSSSFKISASSTLGTSDIFKLTSAGVSTFYDNQTIQKSTNAVLKKTISNTSNTSLAFAQLELLVAGTTAQDPYMTFGVSGGQSYALGLDNSDSDKFKISASSALGTTDCMTLTTTGQLSLNQNVSNALTISSTSASRLVFANTTAQNRHIELYRLTDNEHQYAGFGYNTNILRYQVPATTQSHVFYTGASISSSTELMRVMGTGRVGIGTSAPDKTLEINASTGGSIRLTYNDSNGGATAYSDLSVDASGILSIASTGSYVLPAANNAYALGSSSFRWFVLHCDSAIFYTYASFGDGSVSTPGIAWASDANTGLYRIGADNFAVTCGSTQVMNFLTAGNTQVKQPSFNVYPSANLSNVTGDSTQYTVVFNTENHDSGNNFSSTTFTAPVAGRYEFSATIQISGMTASHTAGFITFVVAGSGLATINTNPNSLRNSASGTATMTLHTILQLAASDALTVVLTVGSSTKTINVIGGRANTYFCGQLLS